MSHTPNVRAPRQHLAALALLATTVLALLVLVPSGAAQAAGAGGSTGTPPGGSWARAGHFVPGMGAVSVEVTPLGRSGEPITLADSTSYGQVAPYDKLTPGRYTATISDIGATSGEQPMLSRSFEATAGEAQTLAVVGTADQPRLVLLSDDLTPPRPGTARVRLLSAASSADTVTVTAEGGPTIAEDAVLGQATDYVSVPAGRWALEVNASGASTTRRAVPLASGSVYTIVALDTAAQQVGLRVVTDAAGAVVRPRGGARTGGGGTAPTAFDAVDAGPGSTSVAVLAGLLLTAGAAVLLARPRRRPGARR